MGCLFQSSERLEPVTDGMHRESVCLKRPAHAGAHSFVVINDEYLALLAHMQKVVGLQRGEWPR